MGSTLSPNLSVLLVENDAQSAQTRKEYIQAYGKLSMYPYEVVVVASKEQAREAIREGRFAFLLVAFFLAERKFTSAPITETDVVGLTNGSSVTKELLAHHRKDWHEEPDDPQQLRPIVFGAVTHAGEEADRVRTAILCDGAHDFIEGDPESPQMTTRLLSSMTDMRELQEYVCRLTYREAAGVFQNLGFGVSIIGKNWKIWYCSDLNAVFSGVNPGEFHDSVCWREYHRFDGRHSPCPECPAAIIIGSSRCADPEGRHGRCITESHEFSDIFRQGTCGCPQSMGGECTVRGRPIPAFANARLLPVAGGKPKWVYVIATPIISSNRKTILGALEAVIDLDDIIESHLERQQLAGTLNADTRLRKILNLVRWSGYNRARVFRLSANEEEIIGVVEVGDLLNLSSFPGYAFDVEKTMVPAAMKDPDMNWEIRTGPGDRADVFNKQECAQYLEFVLRDPRSRETILGTLIVDDVRERPGAVPGSRREYSEVECKRLFQLATYAASILKTQRQHETDAALRRHANSLRVLEERADDFIRATPPTTDIRQFLVDQVREMLRPSGGNDQSEPGIIGFHFRFKGRDDLLHLYPGIGAYAQEGQEPAIEPTRIDSLSAQCLSSKQERSNIDAATFSPFQDFKRKIEELADREPGHRAARQWCSEVKKLGCFLIGDVGTLAVQSNMADFFSTESVRFLRVLCSVIARILRQRQDYESLLESIAYVFLSSAQSIASIAHDWLAVERDAKRLPKTEALDALAQHIYIKSKTFVRDLRSTGNVPPQKKEQPLKPLWRQWCSIFRGLGGSGNKECRVAVDDARCVSRLDAAQIVTDAIFLTEIVFHVYENAVKACDRNIRIVAFFNDHSEFVIEIDDDGKGIAPELMKGDALWSGKRVPFERMDAKGFGLGLKWSKRHASHLGVDLHADANGDRSRGELAGAHFRISVPILWR